MAQPCQQHNSIADIDPSASPGVDACDDQMRHIDLQPLNDEGLYTVLFGTALANDCLLS